MKLKTPKLYCGAVADDLRLALQVLRAKYPKAPVVATGVSLGGILLSRYLIEEGANSIVDVAVLISVVWDFEEGCQSMEKYGLNYALNRHLTRALINLVEENKEILQPLKNINYQEVVTAPSMREFDQRFTSKMWGYPSVDEYYKDASNKTKVGAIKIPTLCVNAADDMFAPVQALPIKEISETDTVTMVVTQRGGHIGFMEGVLPVLPFYSERLLKQFFDALIRLKDMRKDLRWNYGKI